MPAHDDGATRSGGRRPQTSKGGNRGRSGNAARQTLWGFRRWRSVCRRALKACWEAIEGDEGGRPIAIGRTGAAHGRSNDKTAIQGGVTASMIIACREPAKQKCSAGMSPRTCTDHDVSILITAVDASGR